MDYAKQILARRPIVQCITNIVTVNDCANALLAIGASPTMAHHAAEMSEIQAGCDALVCNFGATENFDAMLEAATQAGKLGHPVVIDPVGCGGSSFRREFFWKLVEACRPACIRGNYSEIMALTYGKPTVTGVDAGSTFETSIEEAVKLLAHKTESIVVASGIQDIISDGVTIRTVSGGDILMSRITGTGCMESSLLGAYLAVDNSIDSVVSCCQKVKDAGKIAADMTRECKAGTMTFREKLIDKLYVE